MLYSIFKVYNIDKQSLQLKVDYRGHLHRKIDYGFLASANS